MRTRLFNFFLSLRVMFVATLFADPGMPQVAWVLTMPPKLRELREALMQLCLRAHQELTP